MNSDDTVLKGIVTEVTGIIDQIPVNHRGLEFRRAYLKYHESDVSQKLELAFAREWAKRNTSTCSPAVLYSLMADASNHASDPDPRSHCIPKTEREWEVAELVAATIVQWLGTQNGTSMLIEAFESAGGTLKVGYPGHI